MRVRLITVMVALVTVLMAWVLTFGGPAMSLAALVGLVSVGIMSVLILTDGHPKATAPVKNPSRLMRVNMSVMGVVVVCVVAEVVEPSSTLMAGVVAWLVAAVDVGWLVRERRS